MSERKIEFFANDGKWIAVKKMSIKDSHKKADVARFLASVHESLDRKMWEYLGDEMPLDALDEIAFELTGAQKKGKKWKVGRKSQDEINEILVQLKSPSTTKKIKEHVKRKEMVELAKTYLARRVFELLGVQLEPDPKLIEKHLKNKELGE
jgi:hypothetical protein